MEVKVKTKVVIEEISFYGEKLYLVINYKVKGLTKGRIREILVDAKQTRESRQEHHDRMLARLMTLTEQEVIDIAKEKVTRDINTILKEDKSNKTRDELLKKLNNIKFTFTIK